MYVCMYGGTMFSGTILKLNHTVLAEIHWNEDQTVLWRNTLISHTKKMSLGQLAHRRAPLLCTHLGDTEKVSSCKLLGLHTGLTTHQLSVKRITRSGVWWNATCLVSKAC